MNRIRLLLLLLVQWSIFNGQCSMAFAQDDEPVDIDEWQVMKVEAAKDPFAHGDQFTINFANYTEEEWCYPLPGAKFLSPYGGARHHGGTDIKTHAGDTTRAAFPGEVICLVLITAMAIALSCVMQTDWKRFTATIRATSSR